MKTVSELTDMIRSRTDHKTIDEQVEIDASITRALWELHNAAHDGADLRAYVGKLEEERDQSHENHAALSHEMEHALARLTTTERRAAAFEAALLAVLKLREPQ